MKNKIIEMAIQYVQKIFQNDFSGHDFSHTLRVYKMATHLAQGKNVRMEIVQLAALLHDVDDIKLSPETYKNKDNTKRFLNLHGIDGETTDEICQIIDEISFVGEDSVIPHSVEGKYVQDADRLDAIGAIGIARAFAYGGSHNRIMYDPDIKPRVNMTREEYNCHLSTTINHFYEKLFLLKNLMNTQAARDIAEAREEYMRGFIEEFMCEWDGVR